MVFIFSTPVKIRHLWRLTTIVFMHWCLIFTVLWGLNEADMSPSSSILIYQCKRQEVHTLNGCVMIMIIKKGEQETFIKMVREKDSGVIFTNFATSLDK